MNSRKQSRAHARHVAVALRTHRHRAPRNPLAGLSIVAVAALVTALGIPAQATPPNDPQSAATTALQGQTLAVGPSALTDGTARDDYVVTRTDLGNYEAFAHLASTFTNDPSWAIQWPFAQGVPISSYFGYRSCSGCSSDHQGLDFNPGEGTPIQAIADGIVITASGPGSSWGEYVEIEHTINGQRVVSLYAHMLEGSVPLQVGQSVTVGSLVGQVGNTGQSTGAHLHLGIYLDGNSVTGRATDPYTWLMEHAGG